MASRDRGNNDNEELKKTKSIDERYDKTLALPTADKNVHTKIRQN